ncbi:MAG TPA: hypothetical protein VKU19_02895 [Bryobacteraceae bacterium]|nr:hypothetical protein [Bryobacteraceae bacterium]
MNFRNLLRVALILVPVCLSFAGQDAQAPRLNIVIVEGDGAINNIKQRTARETIVEVQDENHKPVAGAAVVFLLPGDGPGGAFAGGAKSATITTDSAGRASMPRLQPNQNTGQYQIRVNASSAGRQGSITISQSNVAGAAAAGGAAAGAGISGKTIAIIVAVAAAAAAGAAVGLTRNSKSSTGASTITPPTGTISAGSGATLGPPQ